MKNRLPVVHNYGVISHEIISDMLKQVPVFKYQSSSNPRISIVCCFNDLQILSANLLSSLLIQDENFELILVNNMQMRFKSIPKALNYGGSKASGDYIMFVHQDVYLVGEDWLRRALLFLESLPSGSVAGVTGVTSDGKDTGFIVDRGRYWGYPISKPEPVQTLDEQLIIIPRKIFNKFKFDERFKFHSYVADYCLTLLENGHNVYVLPLVVEHNSATIGTLTAFPIEFDDYLLYLKHKRFHKAIYKTTGVVGTPFSTVKRRLTPILRDFYLRIMRLILRFLGIRFSIKEIILDLGCTPVEQIYLKDLLINKGYSVGISDKKRYLLTSKQLKVHDDYVVTSLDKLPFRESSFDIVLLFTVLEYLPKSQANDVISASERVGRKVVVKAYSSRFPQGRLRTFRSYWDVNDFKKRGYKAIVYGIRGLPPTVVLAVK